MDIYRSQFNKSQGQRSTLKSGTPRQPVGETHSFGGTAHHIESRAPVLAAYTFSAALVRILIRWGRLVLHGPEDAGRWEITFAASHPRAGLARGLRTDHRLVPPCCTYKWVGGKRRVIHTVALVMYKVCLGISDSRELMPMGGTSPSKVPE